MYFALYFAGVGIASISQILLKKSAMKEHDSFLKEYLNPYVISGYALMFASLLLPIFALKGMDFKNGPIIESLGFVLVLILSRLFFGEKITKRKLLGIVLILGGMVVFYL